MTWLAAGAAGGVISVAIPFAISRLVPNHPEWPIAVIPGLVFGLLLGALLHLSGPRPAWRIATYGVASTIAHHLAYAMALGFTKETPGWQVGLASGSLGAATLAVSAALLFPAARTVLHVGTITVLGALAGTLLHPALRATWAGTEWSLLILYVPWQAAVALASSFFFLAKDLESRRGVR